MTTIVDTPFDLYDVFINMIFGNQNWSMFLIFSLIILTYICARYRFPNIITITVIILYLFVISPFDKEPLVLGVLLASIFIAWTIGRIVHGAST